MHGSGYGRIDFFVSLLASTSGLIGVSEAVQLRQNATDQGNQAGRKLSLRSTVGQPLEDATRDDRGELDEKAVSVKRLIETGRLHMYGSLADIQPVSFQSRSIRSAGTLSADALGTASASGTRYDALNPIMKSFVQSEDRHLERPSCPRPADWCQDSNIMSYTEADCNGDGALDRICDLHGAQEDIQEGRRRWIMLSGNCEQYNNGAAPSCAEVLQAKPQGPKDEVSEVSECPSLFVVVLSSLANQDRRSYLRQMWADAHMGWGKLQAKFALCVASGISDEISKEADQHGDIMYLDCEEGYLNGRLTLKVITAMRAYLDHFNEYQLFMKTDDDTFVSTRRLCGFLNWRGDQGKDNMNSYFGVFAEGPKEHMYSLHKVVRDQTSPWYEAEEDYPFEDYPASAKGGPGYILPKSFVQQVIQEGIADQFVLRNEDKAVGVWIDRIAKHGNTNVEYVNLPGTDGYSEHADSIAKTGPYKAYPHILHHHLPGASIQCLSIVDGKNEPDTQVDQCF